MRKIILFIFLISITSSSISQDFRKLFSDTTLLKNEIWELGKLSDKYTPKENYDNYSGYFSRGIDLMQENLYNEAIIEFKKSIAKSSKLIYTGNIPSLNKNQPEIDALYNIATCHFLLDNIDSAVYYYEEIINVDQYQSNAYLGLASIYYSKKDFNSIISILIQGTESIPSSAKLKYNLAVAYLLDNKITKCKKLQRQLIEENPKFEYSYLLLGTIYILEQKYQGALSTMSQSIEINSEFAPAYYLRANLYLEQNDYQNAYRDFLTYSLLDSLNPYVERSLAILDFKYGYDSQAIKRLLKWMTINYPDLTSLNLADPWDYETYFLLSTLNSDKVLDVDKKYAADFYREYYWGSKIKAKSILQEFTNNSSSSDVAKRFLLINYYYDYAHGTYEFNIDRDTIKRIVDELIEEMPNEANLRFIKGDLYNFNRINESIFNYKAGAKLYPEYTYSYLSIGNGYYKLKNYDSAAIYYSDVIELDSNYIEAYIRRAECYDRMPGQILKAIEDYNYLITKDAVEFKYPIKRIAKYYTDKEVYDSAIIYWNWLIKKSENNYELLEERAYSYLQIGKYDEAIEDYNRAINYYIQQDKEDQMRQHTYYERGSAFFHVNLYNDAIEDYKSYLNSNPKDIDVRYELADCYIILNDSENALKQYDKAIELDANNKEIYLKKADYYSNNHQYLEAIQCLSQSTLIDPNFALAFGSIGWNYYKLGKFKQCIQFSQKAISIDPSSFYASFNIALALLNLGYFDQAYEVYKNTKSINDEEDNPDYTTYINDLKELSSNIEMKEQAVLILNDIFNYKTPEQ
jgi:tetratricopeptide (TPR) repeat protein